MTSTTASTANSKSKDGGEENTGDTGPVAVAKNGDNEASDPQEDDEERLFSGLRIVSPRQQETTGITEQAVVQPHVLDLPPLRRNEPVQSLRGALSEVIGYAHMTRFQFEVVDPAAAPPKEMVSTTPPPLISPYTTADAVILAPANMSAAPTTTTPPLLDDYADLSSGLEANDTTFGMILQPYDAVAVQDHVNRLRSLLQGHAPATSVLYTPKVLSDAADSSQPQDGGALEDATTTKETKEEDAATVPAKPLPDLKIPSAVSGTTNLGDFFYLAWGDDPPHSEDGGSNNSKKKNKKQQAKKGDDIKRWNEVQEATHVGCTILPSGFHPPPLQRRLLGDIAYFDVTFPDGATVGVTACQRGFYVNGSSSTPNAAPSSSKTFDPSPAAEHCYAHALLDCLLQASESLKAEWSTALEAAKERAEIVARLAPFTQHAYSGIRGDYPGFRNAASAATTMLSDLSPSAWLVPVPRAYSNINDDAWTRHPTHAWNPHRALDAVQCTHGVDIRGGGPRDWNEELQLARDMPTDTLALRIERARVLYKMQYEFAEACLASVLAITHGHVLPMNPTEPLRSHVYLHNTIFVSRAIDAGPETFHLARGDAAARKGANRDAQCIGTLQRMLENTTTMHPLATLATVMIDYLGTRFVCQSILPGILSGERAHTLVYGAVEAGSPLVQQPQQEPREEQEPTASDGTPPITTCANLQTLLERPFGEQLRIATRPAFRKPLVADEDSDDRELVKTCLALEAKGIRGSDQRTYVLDVHRLTPRDANWIPESEGGTGNMSVTSVDEEMALSVVRPELVTQFVQYKLRQRIAERQEKEKKEAGETEAQPELKEETVAGQNGEKRASSVDDGAAAANSETPNDGKEEGGADGEKEVGAKEKEEAASVGLSEEDSAYLESLKFNLNALLPYTRKFKDVDEEIVNQIKQDEDLIRELACFLWDRITPGVHRAVKEGQIPQLPVDGASLTEFLHRHGINCRYLGRLAELAREQEENDARITKGLSTGERIIVERKMMPKFWLELLECEMVARTAKHVLDGYLIESGVVQETQPAQTIASFLSALLSECDETAGQTEIRLNKGGGPDEDDLGTVTIGGVLGSGHGGIVAAKTVRNRREVWSEIEKDVERRFRYKLRLFNTGTKSQRALYSGLLRRVCLRSGIKLAARDYDLGGHCHGGGTNVAGTQLVLSYPISPLDIVEVVPMMKHSAAHSEGFAPCRLGVNGSSSILPPLHVSLAEARASLERAHIQSNGRAHGKALELAQEASTLYTRVADHQIHPGLIDSLELMAKIMHEVGDPGSAALHQGKVIAMSMQSGGIDSPAMISSHVAMFQMLFNAREFDEAAKHMRAAIYLMELMSGSHHTELYSSFHKLGTLYAFPEYKDKYLETALQYFQEARKRGSADRLLDGCMAKSTAKLLEQLERFKEAIEDEKMAFNTLQLFLGHDHQMTVESDQNLKRQTKLAVENANKALAEAAKTEILASTMENVDDDKRKKKTKKKKGKGKASNGKS